MTHLPARYFRTLTTLVIFALSGFAQSALAQGNINDLQRTFDRPPDDSRIMMRWWWFGPAVTKPELEREMRLMKEGGIGGFEVQPVYPLALDDDPQGHQELCPFSRTTLLMPYVSLQKKRASWACAWT